MPSNMWIQRHAIEVVLLGLLALSLYGHYETGKDLRRVCELIGRHDASYGHPLTPQEEIDTICNVHEPD